MRYPLWAFFFLFVIPPFTAHALWMGQADMQPRPGYETQKPAPNTPTFRLTSTTLR